MEYRPILRRLSASALALSFLFGAPGVRADDKSSGGDSSGGTTFSASSGKTLDSETYDTLIPDPELAFPAAYRGAQGTLAALEERIPVLAQNMQHVFDEPLWWRPSRGAVVKSRTADSKINVVQETGIHQDQYSVLVQNEFPYQARAEQVTSLVHEGVRFVAIKKKLSLDDKRIQFITRVLENAHRIPSDEVLRDSLFRAGMGYYMTRGEIRRFIESAARLSSYGCNGLMGGKVPFDRLDAVLTSMRNMLLDAPIAKSTSAVRSMELTKPEEIVGGEYEVSPGVFIPYALLAMMRDSALDPKLLNSPDRGIYPICTWVKSILKGHSDHELATHRKPERDGLMVPLIFVGMDPDVSRASHVRFPEAESDARFPLSDEDPPPPMIAAPVVHIVDPASVKAFPAD